MTSKSLYFNLLKEDIKRRVWTISLSMLAFFIALPIHTLLRLSRMKASMELGKISEAQGYFAKMANKENIGILLAITMAGAVICAINGFFYLYSKSKIDSYHSIPVKREKLFLASFLNGVLIYVVPYCINLILYYIIGAANGLLTVGAISDAISAFFINLTGFLLMYSVTIIAVMLTGNLIVGLLGTAVFMFYGPIVVTIKRFIFEIFFHTYYQMYNTDTGLQYVSPIFAYVQLNMLAGEKQFPLFYAGFLMVTIIAILTGLFLYKKRPSEAAGRSMAFVKTQSIIKTLIVIPTALVGGMVFMSVSESESFGWLLFGILFIGILAHGIIEIIYNSDFKSIVANKVQLGICILLSVCIGAVAKYDLFGYDTYLPKENSLESMSISFNNLESNNEYYDFNNKIVYPNQYTQYEYIDPTTYQLSHVKLTDYEPAYELAKYAIEHNNNKSEDSESAKYVDFYVKYTNKNTSQQYRNYKVNIADAMSYIDKIYSDEGYKQGVYQIYSMDKDLIDTVQYFNSVEGIQEPLKLTKEQIKELANIYESEMLNLSAKEAMQEIPVTDITLLIGKGDGSVSQSYNVYPSFTKTIEYLKSVGANMESAMNVDNIEEITLIKYAGKQKDSDYEPQKYTFTSKEDISQISNALILDRFTRGLKYGLNINYDLQVDIKYKYSGNPDTSAFVILDKLPENIRKQIE